MVGLLAHLSGYNIKALQLFFLFSSRQSQILLDLKLTHIGSLEKVTSLQKSENKLRTINERGSEGDFGEF